MQALQKDLFIMNDNLATPEGLRMTRENSLLKH